MFEWDMFEHVYLGLCLQMMDLNKCLILMGFEASFFFRKGRTGKGGPLFRHEISCVVFSHVQISFVCNYAVRLMVQKSG